VILDDADLEPAVRSAVRNGLLNSGQTCSAWTRLIVPSTRQDEASEIARATAQAMSLGDPTDEATQLGPLISAAHRETVQAHIDRARADGLREAYAGTVPKGLGGGAYLAPHVFAGVGPEHALAQEEVFGPVLAIMPADDEDHAVDLANSTIYGLAGGVFSGDDERALAVARRLRTGQVDVNGGAFNPEAPFGGYHQSGNGRELGRYGLEEFLEVKAIQR
jgi:aldehyde dehydrogenase (NAD+)